MTIITTTPCEVCNGPTREFILNTEDCQACQGTGFQPLIDAPNPFDEVDASDLIPANPTDDQGYILDPVTDIPVGHVDAYAFEELMDPEARAEFLVFRLHETDSRRAQLEWSMREEIRKATERITAYYMPQIARQQRRRDWLLVQYFLPVQEWARQQLAGAKERSIKLVFGTLMLRKTGGRIALREGINPKNEYGGNTDPDLLRMPLVKWALTHQPQAVKVTEAFQISKLPKSITIDDLPVDLFEQTRVTEKFEIDTGVCKSSEDDVVEPKPLAIEADHNDPFEDAEGEALGNG